MPPGFSGFVEPGLSFSPEKTQIELACDVAASFGVRLPGGPITSLAKAALALAPVRAAAQTATATNDLLRMAFLLSNWPGVAGVADADSLVADFLRKRVACYLPTQPPVPADVIPGRPSGSLNAVAWRTPGRCLGEIGTTAVGRAEPPLPTAVHTAW